MSLQQLTLIELDGQLPARRVIDAEQLERQFQQMRSLHSAEMEAIAILKSARRRAEKTIRQATRIQRQAQVAARAEKARLRRRIVHRCEVHWLKNHVMTLCAHEALEQRLVDAVSTRIRCGIGQVLTAWFEQQSGDDTLCARLSMQVEKMAKEGALTLHIHPALEQRVRQQFGHRVTILCESQFAQDKAVLASSQLAVTFSVNRHFQLLRDWLCGPKSGTGEQDDK